MNDSNRTLRWNRTLREAGWSDLQDHDRDWQDKLVAWAVYGALVFILGLLLGLRMGGV